MTDKKDEEAEMTELLEKTLDERKREVQAFVGEPVQVYTLDLQLEQVDKEGIFVDIDAKSMGIFYGSMPWAALGITLPNDLQIKVGAPGVTFLPEDYLRPMQRAVDRARQAHAKYSLRLSFLERVWGTKSYGWVPRTAWPEFDAAFKTQQRALREARDLALANYDTLVQIAASDFRRIIADALPRLAAQGAEFAPDWKERTAAALDALLPSREQIRSIDLLYHVGIFQLGSSWLAEAAKAVQARATLSDAQKAELEALEEQRITRELARQKIWAEHEVIKKQAQVAIQMEQAKLEAWKETLQDMKGPMQEAAQQVQRHVYEQAEVMLKAVRTRGILHASTAKAGRNLAELFRSMNFMNDRQLASLIDDLEKQLEAKPAKGETRTPVEPIERVLDEIVKHTWSQIAELTEHSRFDALQLAPSA